MNNIFTNLKVGLIKIFDFLKSIEIGCGCVGCKSMKDHKCRGKCRLSPSGCGCRHNKK